MTLRKTKAIGISARRLQWSFTGSRSLYWHSGSAAISAILNTYTLLVPDNEQYYIRAIRPHLKDIQDQRLRSQVIEFMKQESLHGLAHQKYWVELSRAGINVERFVRACDFLLYRVLEPLQPSWLKLSIVAAIEHINASIADSILKGDLLSGAEPELKRLFEWHFAEEIEHKAVAHDVLTSRYPSYLARVSGAVLAYTVFYSLIALGTSYLLISSKNFFRIRTARDLSRFLLQQGGLKDTFLHFIRYLSPTFDPWSLNNRELATLAMERISRTGSEDGRSAKGDSPAIYSTQRLQA